GRPSLAVEFVAGGSLARGLGGEPQPPRDAARLVLLLARAVQAAHRAGLVHRDLKPANVLLAPPADEPALNCAWGWPKLTDFGLARRVEGGAGTHSGMVMGTPRYMAPEQAEGKQVGPAADVYALGAILYELLTGRPPFVGDSSLRTLYMVLTEAPAPPRRLQPTIPEALDSLCLACLDKQPERRPGVAGLIVDLARFLAGDPVSTVLVARAA